MFFKNSLNLETREKLLIGLLIIFFALNLFLFMKYRSLKTDLIASIKYIKKLEALNYLKIDKIENPEGFSLRLFSNGKQFSLKNLTSKINILIFFTPDDCLLCMGESKIWEEIYNKYDHSILKIIGVTDFRGKETGEFIRDLEVSFPILIDENFNLKSHLNINFTPFKVALDKEKNIIFFEPGTSNKVQQEELLNKIKELVEIYS